VNPFDLRGPEFLVFYATLGAAVLVALAARRWFFEPQAPVEKRLTDPSSIAYLRAGPREVLRLAVLSLIERGLLEASGTMLEAKTADHPELPVLEQLILKKYARPGEASGVFSDGTLDRECTRVRASLEASGLVPDASLRALRWWSTFAGVAVLAIVALIKIGVALQRGKSNVQFLIALAVASCIGAILIARSPRTPRGSAMIQDLQSLLEQARRQYLDPRSSAEVALVMATFGVAGQPDSIHAARAQQLFPSTSSSSCGSSWGGSSCGSSCGGGCGGGCGGCGS